MAVLLRTASLHTNPPLLTLPKQSSLLSRHCNTLLPPTRLLPNPNSLKLRGRSSPPFPSRCLAAQPGLPPPESDPESDPNRFAGLEGSMSRLKDRTQIFLAVLVWMSLFFWTCVWDDRNTPNKGSSFRR